MDKSLNLDGVPYHQRCARCEKCDGTVTLSNFTPPAADGSLLCKVHYMQAFRESGTYAGGDKFIKASNNCTVLNKDPKKSAAAAAHVELHSSSASLTTVTSPPTPSNTGKLSASSAANADSSSILPNTTTMSSSASNDETSLSGTDKSLFPQQGKSNSVTTNTINTTTTTKRHFQPSTALATANAFAAFPSTRVVCYGCHQAMYAMDKVVLVSGQKKYHSQCCRCVDCGSQLDARNIYETPEGELVCETHRVYRKKVPAPLVGKDEKEADKQDTQQWQAEDKIISPTSDGFAAAVTATATPSPASSNGGTTTSSSNENGAEKRSVFSFPFTIISALKASFSQTELQVLQQSLDDEEGLPEGNHAEEGFVAGEAKEDEEGALSPALIEVEGEKEAHHHQQQQQQQSIRDKRASTTQKQPLHHQRKKSNNGFSGDEDREAIALEEVLMS